MTSRGACRLNPLRPWHSMPHGKGYPVEISVAKRAAQTFSPTAA